ncbi:hypothetical protein [Candidatus Phytoplasma citri]|uniref:Uncharacterized protein n=2 Tax=Candidatus Phytoplasma citri TaxID=180978 RepID=A0A1S9LYQ8_9MOLU|nr:hypothetical protein [Candidatus Phytoplasma aurantifolia]OOP58074.1 hypothetical protein B2G44_02205 [Candidatus Phytoplasma aurantifolia]
MLSTKQKTFIVINSIINWDDDYKDNLLIRKTKFESWDSFFWKIVKGIRNYQFEITGIIINPNIFPGQTKLIDKLTE